MIETLEFRRLLTAVLQSNGILNITGGAGNQTVVLTIHDHKDFQPSGGFQQIPYVHVTTDGTVEGEFNTLKIKRLAVSLGDGNDSFTVPTNFQFAMSVRGGNGNDTLVGGRNRDTLDGDAGNDSLVGNRGDDILGSGFGSDTLVGGLGFDTADYHQRTAALTLSEDGASNDGASGETGNLHNDVETILGGFGNDHIDCSGFVTTKDIVTGYVQGVSVMGNNGKDTIIGSGGFDTIRGGSHSDSIMGGAGDDQLFGDRGNDRLFGEDGTDTLTGNDDGLRDTLDGGAGLDVAFPDYLDRTVHV